MLEPLVGNGDGNFPPGAALLVDHFEGHVIVICLALHEELHVVLERFNLKKSDNKKHIKVLYGLKKKLRFALHEELHVVLERFYIKNAIIKNISNKAALYGFKKKLCFALHEELHVVLERFNLKKCDNKKHKKQRSIGFKEKTTECFHKRQFINNITIAWLL